MHATKETLPLRGDFPAKVHDAEDGAGYVSHGYTVSSCEASVRSNFLKKVFGLVAAQLTLTVAVCALFMFEPHVQQFVLHTPSMMMISFFTSLGFLFAAQCYKDTHPQNLYYMFGFTLSMAWGVGVTCALYQAKGYGIVVLEALAVTASVTAALTAYTLKSKRDFSYLGAGLGASLWVLIFGGLLATLTHMPALHLAMSVGGAAIFSLYIVYDVHEIAKRLSPDEYVPAAISLYLDIVNLFLHILRILASLQDRN